MAARTENGRVGSLPKALDAHAADHIRERILDGRLGAGTHLVEADLEGAILWDANFQEANLREANLFGASLVRANLQGAYLEGVNLQGAELYGANLQVAFLLEAKVTGEQLANTLSLRRATMPDGQKYEDWLEDKEGSEKDAENE